MKKKSFYIEKSQISTKSPSHNQISPNSLVSAHKRTQTFDLRHNFPQNNDYQLEKKFTSFGLLKRKDSCPLKGDSFKELLKSSDFSMKKTTIIDGIPNSIQIQKKMSMLKPKPMSTEFLKDLNRIYDSNFKTSRTFKEYEEFFNSKYFALDKNMKSINCLEQKSLSLSKEIFLSEEHRQILAKTMRNYEKNKAEMLS